jgi:hypothetical protein
MQGDTKLKKSIVFLLALIILILSFNAYSQGYKNDRNKKIDKIKADLNLTKEQENKIATIMDDFRVTVDQLKIDHERAKLNLREELIKDNPNMDKIKALIKDKNEIMSKIEFFMIKRDLDIKSILTKEQLEKWRFIFKREHPPEKPRNMNFRNKGMHNSYKNYCDFEKNID